MVRRGSVTIGLLFSMSGPYATIGRAMLNGARLAIAEVNADPGLAFSIEAVAVDPGGRNTDYAAAAYRLLDEDPSGTLQVVLDFA